MHVRAVVWQILVVALVGAAVVAIGLQTADNLQQRGIASGFAYLDRATGFEIAPGLVPYSSRDTYVRALALGIVNTLQVTLAGIAIATTLGVLVGIARLSRIWIVSALSRAYVEILRNTPLLLQLLFWYALSQSLPPPDRALQPLPGVFLCVRGLFFPRVELLDGHFASEWPVHAGFGFHGGLSMSPELAVMVIGLSTSTAAFIGEIVRGGIQSVAAGQTEAALALGLSRARTLRLVLLPQALPVIVPPLTSQFLNLLKNSSLAVAIGYADLMSITSTTLNQTGQAIEAIAVATAIYLGVGLAMSLAMNIYNRAVALPTRDRSAP